MKKVSLVLVILSCSVIVLATRVERVHVHFTKNSFELSEEATDQLHALLLANSCCIVEKVDIEGHCDQQGSNAFNLELSKLRALEVYDYLTRLFPDRGDYEIRYVGEEHPVSLEDDDPNRCVLVTVYLLERDYLDESPKELAEFFPEEFFPSEKPVEAKKATPENRPKSTYIPEHIEKDAVFQIENIYFYGNSSIYTSKSDESLNELLSFMLYYPDVKIRLEGHVNGKMGSRYLKKAGKSNPEKRVYANGKELSLARAESIRDYLVQEGVDPDRIECLGKGGSDRLYKKPKNQKEHEANRRIEVIILNM
jgi:outer membrane protein OmpA-like peptidoglycan-associated protein